MDKNNRDIGIYSGYIRKLDINWILNRTKIELKKECVNRLTHVRDIMYTYAVYTCES